MEVESHSGTVSLLIIRDVCWSWSLQRGAIGATILVGVPLCMFPCTNSDLSDLFHHLQGSRHSAGKPLSNWKKFHEYELEVDPEQDDKATEIMLCSFERPHMRAFHCAWWAFFVAFFSWFAISPLLPSIRTDLALDKKDIWTSSIAAVGSTILIRFILGPLCDVYGPKILFSITLCATAIPTALIGVVQTKTDLIVLRCFIGLAGGTFVMAQYWPSRMFAKEVVGTANALIAGWGNLGAGVTQLVIGSYLLPLFELMTGSSETAWRTVGIVPAVVSFVTGIVIYRISDDAPKGNYWELKKHNAFTNPATIQSSFVKGFWNINTWVLFVQYACCFGVELTMYNAAVLYFVDEFDQTTEAASAITSIFGWLNLFARGLGGFFSDASHYKYGMRGRLWTHTLLLLFEGILVLVFASTTSLGGAIFVLICFSLCVQAAEGTSFGIVPYIDPLNMGSVTGIVGAGGNVGAVAFGLCFRQLSYETAFNVS